MAGSKNLVFWQPGRPDGKRFAAAFGVGLIIELAALGALLPWLGNHPQIPSDHPAPIRISVIIAPAPPTPPTLPPVIRQPPKPVPPPLMPVAPPLPLPPLPDLPAQHRTIARPPRRHAIRPPVIQPPPVQAPQTPPAAPRPAAPPAPNAGELDVFQAAMRRAVQAQATGIEPGAALMAREAGETQIRFTYLNGLVSDVQVVASSGFPLLDEAALEAARTATYPPPPPDLAGQPHVVVVGIIFQAAAASIDSD